MKAVLLLIKALGRGGAERSLVDTAHYLDRERFRYEVAYLDGSSDQCVPDLEEIGLPVHCLRAGTGPGWLPRLRRLVRERSIDVVHAQSPYAGAGARLALLGGPPVVYTEQNNWASYRRLTYWANLMTFGLNERVFTVSDDAARSIRYPLALNFLPMPPIETMYNGIDLARVPDWERAGRGAREVLGLPPDVPVVGTVANFRPEKGHPDLLAAAELVLLRVPDAHFVLIGSGPTEADVRRVIAERGLEASVTMAGSREDAVALMGAFDVFALASHHEGLPIALLEAMALARPMAVTAAGGIPEVVRSGEHGFVVPRGDPAALARGIVRLLEDRELAVRMGSAAKDRVSRFDIRTIATRLELAYQQAAP